MNKIIFILTLFLASTTTIFAQSDEEFTYATSDKQGDNYYVYIESTESNYSKVWIKSITTEKSYKNKKGKLVKTGGGKTMTFVKINCSDREYDSIESTTYNKSGSVINYRDYPIYNEKVIPGSVMSGIFRTVCNE